MYEYLELLQYIAKKEGLFGSLKSSTLSISKEINISQQTISRKLREMENKCLVKRLASPNGLIVSLDDKGRGLLQENYRQLNSIFKTQKTTISGTVEKGIGEGSYYVSQKQYQQQFKAKLGFTAFPGTLNLKINKEELAQFIANKESIDISGFATKTRSFGSITTHKIKILWNSKNSKGLENSKNHPKSKILECAQKSFAFPTFQSNNIEAAIVKPKRARHPEDIIEIIAPVNLRQELKLDNKDKVKLS